MKSGRCPSRWVLTTLLLVLFLVENVSAQPNIQYATQGYSMHLTFDNQGVFRDLEYPVGSTFEQTFGAGIWVGGRLDTSQVGTSAPLRLVSAAYEGWAGPLTEFFPGSSPADTIWKVNGRGVPRPPSWDQYWGNLIPRVSFSDNDHYCLFTDERITPPVVWHVPLHLKIAQSGYVWDEPYAEAVEIVEYKIVNTGSKEIDSAYVAFFLEGGYGSFVLHPFYTQYHPDRRVGFIHDPVEVGPTPMGVALLHSSQPLDSLQYAFVSFTGPQTPVPDQHKYDVLSSGLIQPTYPNLVDARFVFSVGPFRIRPGIDPNPDTLQVVFAIVSGQSVAAMLEHADHAKLIYENGGQVPVDEGSEETAHQFELLQNYPNPFNPSTRIKFRVPSSEFVTLKVFDVLGREVASLVNEAKQPGIYEVTWTPNNLGSGVYFCRLESASFVETRKLILMR